MGLASLWLPILLSAVFVFVASSIIHMVLQLHNKDHGQIPGEDEVRAAIRKQSPPAGDYMMPWAPSFKEASTPEMLKKFEEGPVALVTVLPNGMPAMGKNLLLWFLYSVIVSAFAGYVTGIGLGPGAEYMDVFRATGTIAILGYGATHLHNSIWKAVPWSTTFRFVIDGVIYGLLTAGVFGWLWPDA